VLGYLTRFVVNMGSFGEDLRMERLSRGIALEQITAVTKISQRHLVALEQEHFGLLPGGILNKGIVRGYASAVGLDQSDWTERYLRAHHASGQRTDDDNGWEVFASNVGRARIELREAAEIRLRWIGAIVLLSVVCTAAYFSIHYFGLRAGWLQTILPVAKSAPPAHALLFFFRLPIRRWFSRL
jgi:cytoskeletal protein RodZ